MSERQTILKVNDLDAGYQGNVVLQDVNFILKAGEILSIIGQNGSGKSTLVKTICGLLPRKRGQIQFDGWPLNDTAPHKLSGNGISYFAQGGLIMPDLTVKEHLQLAGSARAGKLQKTHFEDAFATFSELEKLENKLAGNLSGGQRQMLSFAILLMQDTSFWILDEPTAGLAPEMVAITTDFLQKTNLERGITILLVEHNMDVAFKLASKVAITKRGSLTRPFKSEEFLEAEFLDKFVYQ